MKTRMPNSGPFCQIRLADPVIPPAPHQVASNVPITTIVGRLLPAIAKSSELLTRFFVKYSPTPKTTSKYKRTIKMYNGFSLNIFTTLSTIHMDRLTAIVKYDYSHVYCKTCTFGSQHANVSITPPHKKTTVSGGRCLVDYKIVRIR